MKDAHPPPHEIRYHSRSRVLELRFADGTTFELSAAVLRGCAGLPPAAAEAGVASIVPCGSDAIVLRFDDGGESRQLSWSELYRLGVAAGSAAGGPT